MPMDSKKIGINVSKITTSTLILMRL